MGSDQISVTTTHSVVVWDHRDDPTAAAREILLWQSYGTADSNASVPRHLEVHAERIRSKYLAFVHDLGETLIAGKRIVDHLDYGDGLSFWWMSKLAEKSPLKSPRIYDCLRLFALEEMLVERCARNLTLVSADEPLAQAMEAMCRNLRIDFSWQRSAAQERRWSLRGLYRALPHAVKGLVSLRRVITRWRLRRLTGQQWFAGDHATFICSYFIHLDPNRCANGQFQSRQWESLPEMLRRSGKRTNWLQLFLLSAAVPDVDTGLSWARLFNADASNQGRHVFLDTYLTPAVVFRTLKCWLWLLALSWRLRRAQSAFRPQDSAVWLWPLLRGDWWSSLCGQTGMENSLLLAQFQAALADLPPQPVGLYLWENQAWEKALLRAWRKHGHGRIIGVQHSTTPFWHLYNFDDPRCFVRDRCALPLPDVLAVNGPASWKAFAAAGFPQHRLAEVEALRYLGLKELAATSSSLIARNEAAAERRGLKILIVGDMIPASMHHLLGLLQRAIKLLPNAFELTLKPHPGYAVNLAEYPGMEAVVTAESLAGILARYDVAVAANSTSAAVDAYVAGLPVIIGLDGDDLNLSPLRGSSGVRFVTTPEELAEALQTAGREVPTAERDHFFFLDAELPRWRRLLGCPAGPEELSARAAVP
jgi:surface carbohydrate biosynthesis protein (TIGR04326 family)